MNRLEPIKFPLTNKRKAFIKRWYKQENGLNPRANDERIQDTLGVHTPNFMNIIGDLYNGYVLTHNANIRIEEQRIENERLRIENERLRQENDRLMGIEDERIRLANEQIRRIENENNNIVNFNFLKEYVDKWSEINGKGKFTLTIKSLIADIRFTWNFMCKAHFDNWFQQIIDNEESTDSHGNLSYNFLQDNPDLFRGEVFIENISLVAGGCNRHNITTDKEILTPFYKFKTINPTSENNNCYFACLKVLIPELKNNYLARDIRKLFGIPKYCAANGSKKPNAATACDVVHRPICNISHCHDS